jgi:hypothetical protein
MKLLRKQTFGPRSENGWSMLLIKGKEMGLGRGGAGLPVGHVDLEPAGGVVLSLLLHPGTSAHNADKSQFTVG